MITFDDFQRSMRVGTVIRRDLPPEARNPSIKMWVDFGAEIGEKKTSAQVTVHYTPESLIGRQVLAVVEFPARQIGKFSVGGAGAVSGCAGRDSWRNLILRRGGWY
jgi:tRNA-binding protein